MYKNLAGFGGQLNGHLTDTDRHLPMERSKIEFLLTALGDGGYSFLELRDGKASEYVRVENVCGKIVITRGAEQTRPLAFRCGTLVAFRLTMQGVKDMVCQMENCNA